MADKYYRSTVSGRKLVAITPNDNVDLTTPIRGIIVGTAGVINGIAINDTSAVQVPVAAGVVIPIQFKRILATSTTALNIVGVI